MTETKTFCEECRNDVHFIINEVTMEGTIKGKKYTYLGKEACCTDCGSELWLAELNDYNLKSLYDIYREENSIISLESILSIPKKYSIGRRPLSLLLGWGEQTFSRYCEGDIPSNQYSEILKKIYTDPYYYAEILENNKEKMKSTVAYDKSKKAIDAIIETECRESSKIYSVSKYLLIQCEGITSLALQKALYYIQGFYYAFYKTFLFTEDCEAWIHGPVYRDIFYKYRNQNFETIIKDNNNSCPSFSTTEKAILDSIIDNFCCYSGKKLAEFTHSETPWLSTRGNLPADKASEQSISKNSIGNYFNSVKDKYNMLNPSDIKKYAKDMFEQV